MQVTLPVRQKQQQVRPLDTPYKEVEHSLAYAPRTAVATLKGGGRDRTVRQHKEITEKTKKYVDSLYFSGLSS